jgi:hypothetical protein
VGLVGLLGGCGSGGGGAASGPVSASTSGSAAASGTITGFGSVIVNGKRFDTTGASFVVDGQLGIQNDLKLGMTVTVTGSFNGDQRSASTVQQKDAVEGLVQSIAVDGSSLVVMGQTVLVDSTTLIDNNIKDRNILTLVPETDFVEVNGHIRPDGVIQATFIEKKIPGLLTPITPEVRGFVSAHDAGVKTFKIGNLTVNYTTALIDVKMPSQAGNAWDGLFVEVKGIQFVPVANAQPPQGTLTATKVDPENQGLGNNMDEFEVEGFVTRVDGPGNFFIGTTHVQTTAGTGFLGGTIGDIVVGAKLSAEGRLADGILTAKNVVLATATRFGFDVLSRNGFNATLEGSWTHNGADVFSNVSNSAVMVRGDATVTIDDKGRPRFSFPEFTFQGVDLFNKGTSTASFTIAGYRTGDDRLPTFFLTVPVTVSHTRLPNSLLDDSARPMNVKIDELRITGVTSSPFEFGVGCLVVGASGGSTTCPIPGGGGNVP